VRGELSTTLRLARLVTSGAMVEPGWLTNETIRADPRMLSALLGEVRPESSKRKGPETGSALLRAYNKATGKDAGSVYMPTPHSGSPMTYAVNGKQYIVVAIGGQGYNGEYVAESGAVSFTGRAEPVAAQGSRRSRCEPRLTTPWPIACRVACRALRRA